MFKKLESVERKFDELTEKLSDPAIISNQNTFQKIAKERSDLSELIETYREYKQVACNLTDNKTLIKNEDDKDLIAMAEEEIPALEKTVEELEQKLKLLLLPKDPNDEKNILLEIRAGTGGEEAALFAADLFRMYQRYAEEKKWKVEVMSQNATGLGGIRELIAMISGDKVFSDLKYESGVHRVQRVPSTEASGRIHTSACTVAVLPEAEDVDIQLDEKDLRIDICRASGPGGQGVNTTDSAVRITHIPTGAVVACQDERSQHKNKARAMKILQTRVFDIESQKRNAERSATRRSMVGSGDRSEKIRTYNFPQNRLSDHRIGLSLHNLLHVLEGNLNEVIIPLRTHYQMEALKNRDE
ncbi:MAG: peptide chain release factor 1 [Deltaproteobacteria bacterium]|jgi:peptide chain release factor 1|nr:peptide chain release factor 1 [Deltaproteobacteria bacterium]